MIRVAIAGCGHMGRLHARTVAADRDAALVGFVDPRRERAEALAARHGGRVLPALPTGVDAVIVAVPTPVHAEVARPSAEAGQWALVEKPLSGGAAQAAALAVPTIAVGHSERFHPAVRALGPVRPRSVRATRAGPHTGRCADADVISELAIHDLDLVLWWWDADPEALAVDAVGHHDAVRIWLSDGSRSAELLAVRGAEQVRREVVLDGDQRVDLRGIGAPPDALTAQWRAFRDLMEGRQSACPSGVEALRAVVLADRVRRALRPGAAER